MKNIAELDKTIQFLSQALNIPIRSNDQNVIEARAYIKHAIGKLESAKKSQSKKRVASETNFQKWWGTIQSGVANAALTPMSPHAQMKSIKELNALIDNEKKKLTELENLEKLEKQTPTTQTELLED